MTDVLEQLRKAVGDRNVVSGAAVHSDYTHDEALTALRSCSSTSVMSLPP
jgi:hypothetical protein